MGGRHKDGMFYREHEVATGFKGRMNHADKTGKIPDVMKGQRTIGKIEARLRQFQRFEVCNLILNGARGGVLSGAVDHVFREIQPENAGRPLPGHPAGCPAKTAAQIHHMFAGKWRQHGTDGRPFRRAIQPMHLTRKLAVTGKKGRIVINILRHAKLRTICFAAYHLSLVTCRVAVFAELRSAQG
ncbi:hypothetical protein D3C80_1617720 [compost metagenome]